MKIAIVFNRESQRVINLFGLPNREKYGLKSIKRITDALKKGGHRVQAFEGDKDLIDRLEEFMPRVVKGERPGMVFNLSYGIQGQARYTHVPGILEMIGLPYVGSGPLAHSLSLDKVVSKMIFVQNGLPTPEFAVLHAPGFEMPDLRFPLIVKPKNEAVSFGIKIVRSEKELREASDVIFQQFEQPVLVERYIPGREINVGLLGNHPPEALPPAEILFGAKGPQIYTYEDKARTSGREIQVQCPAAVDEDIGQQAQAIAKQAFSALGCVDCARVDMRLDKDGKLYILEVNSLPSLGEHGSYVQGAAAVGLDFSALVNRLVEVASARYFGTPSPPDISAQKGENGDRILTYLSSRRDQIERDVEAWCAMRSRTSDPVGMQEARKLLDEQMAEVGLKQDNQLSDPRVAWVWKSAAGLENGTLIVGHLDVPLENAMMVQRFRRDPEWLYGEGIGMSRAPLVAVRYALKALKRIRKLRNLPIGVLYYADEGRDCRYSAEVIRQVAGQARQVLVMRPGGVGDTLVTGRRGLRRYRLVVECEPLRLGKSTRKPHVTRWMFDRLDRCERLTSRKDRIAVAPVDIQTAAMPMLLPHQAHVALMVSYPEEAVADRVEKQIHEILGEERDIRWKLETVSSRPPMKERRANMRLVKKLEALARERDIPLKRETSVWPSVAGLVPASVGTACGVGPAARDLSTPHEAVLRISLLQRTLLLAEFLSQ